MHDMTNQLPGNLPVTGRRARAAFTLIELLTVIAVIAIIAGLLMPVFNMVERKSMLQQANAEMQQLITAIDNYHAHYGFYPPGNAIPALATTNQLYYELLGTTATNNAASFTTLDNSATVLSATIMTYFNVSGFMGCSRGSGDDAVQAQSFLPALKTSQIATNGDISLIVTAVNSGPGYAPLPGFKALNGTGIANPWRYVYPGVNNPNSYDLWVKVIVGGKTNLICNWNNQQQYNSTLP